MSTATSAARGFRPRVALGYLGAFAGFGVGLSALYATSGAGLPCLFRAVTGWQCPLCGGTRLGAALLHADLAGAFAANPVVLVGLVVLAVLGGLWTVEALGGPAVRPPERVSVRLRRVKPDHWLLAALVGSAVFVLLRNLL